jgi:hypothetical protein
MNSLVSGQITHPRPKTFFIPCSFVQLFKCSIVQLFNIRGTLSKNQENHKNKKGPVGALFGIYKTE